MALVTAGDIFTVTVRGRLFNQLIINTFAYRLASTEDTQDYAEMMEAFDEVWRLDPASVYEDLLDAYPNNLTVEGVWYQKIWPTRLYAYKVSVNDPGEIGVATTTANLAATITRRGELGNRRNVSTLHIPVVTGDITYLNNGVLLVPETTPLQTLAGRLSGVQPVVLGDSLFEPVIYNKGQQTPYSRIIAANVPETARVMRRRTVGHGE